MSKKVVGSPQVRILKLLVKLMESRFPIALAEFNDEDEWGDERTFRRLRNNLNAAWEEFRGTPLFEIVDTNGIPKDRGADRFIKLADANIHTSRVERMAVMPALMELLGTVKGTIISDSYTHMYDNFRSNLDRKQQKFFDRTSRKFYYFGKGSKDYGESSDILDEVYDALLREQKLEITRVRKGESLTQIVRPLTLVLFNNGLYLACRFDDQDEDTPPYKFKLESFVSARCLKGQGFTYPEHYDPAKLFEGSFGFIRNSDQEPFEVICEFSSDSWVHSYLKERKWTGEESYSVHDARTRMTMHVTDLREVASWVLGIGPEIKVLQPQSLAQEVYERALTLTENHSGVLQ